MAIGVYNEAEQFYASPLAGAQPFSTVAGMTDMQRAGFEGGISAASQYVPEAERLANAYRQQATQAQATGGVNLAGAGAANQVGASFDPYNTQGLNDAVAAMRSSANREFNQQVAPYLNDEATMAGQLGGTRGQISEGIRRSNLDQALLEQEAQMRAAGYEAGLGRYVQDRGQTLQAAQSGQRDAMSALDAYRSASTDPRNAVYDLSRQVANYGSAEQALNQARLNEFGQQYNRVINEPQTRLEAYNALLQNSPGSGLSSSTATTRAQDPTNWGQMVAGIGNYAFGGAPTSTYSPMGAGISPTYNDTGYGTPF